MQQQMAEHQKTSTNNNKNAKSYLLPVQPPAIQPKKPEQLLQQNQTPNIMDSLSLYFSHPSTEILAA